MYLCEIVKDFKKYYLVTAPPDQVYLALTNAATFHLWSGDVADIQAIPDGEFSLWDGSITGRFLELEPSVKIVQQWYFGDQQEDSVVTIKLHPHAQGTSVELRHTNIPDADYDDIIEGWNETYFTSLQEFYE